jgi:hypothetical protein
LGQSKILTRGHEWLVVRSPIVTGKSHGVTYKDSEE